tara:strand:- start:15042 stop:15374 length:333 start_codon:yes stop_codon:yes gene_type:complete
MTTDLTMKPFNFGGRNEPPQLLGIGAQTASNDIQIGIWECGPGLLDLEFEWTETVYVLEGRAEVENIETKECFEMTPGTMRLFEAGSRWQWRIPWRFKKVFTTVDRLSTQ